MYRFFTLNVYGVVDTVTEVRLADDGAARDYGATLDAGVTIEVWRGSQRIAVLPPRAARPQRL